MQLEEDLTEKPVIHKDIIVDLRSDRDLFFFFFFFFFSHEGSWVVLGPRRGVGDKR